jgi:hypothetical protein
LYALDRSTDAIELEPPAAKKAACCSSRAEVLISAGESCARARARRRCCRLKRRCRGMLAGRDWVRARRV